MMLIIEEYRRKTEYSQFELNNVRKEVVFEYEYFP